MQLVKAEILWTRRCPLSCHYCRMKTGKYNSQSSSYWRVGLENLKQLNVPFIAIYGAEPLYDFEKLPKFISDATDLQIESTVITSGLVSDWQYKLDKLYDVGLRSLTTSYDITTQDASGCAKTAVALKRLDFFRRGGRSIHNVAVVVTLTRQNFMQLPETIRKMSDCEIWTFFDIIHPDRGQVGSKTRGKDEALLFQHDDIPQLISVLKEVQTLKHAGYEVHCSEAFLEFMITHSEVIENFTWNCADYDCFPSWVTVDCDGMVYPCDDFQPPELGVPVDKLASRYAHLKKLWQASVKRYCPGCCWNTHVDAHFIKSSVAPITGYIHV
jgi:MoaA/NifB/PqqE/SkfB family radical SAM enzyme